MGRFDCFLLLISTLERGVGENLFFRLLFVFVFYLTSVLSAISIVFWVCSKIYVNVLSLPIFSDMLRQCPKTMQKQKNNKHEQESGPSWKFWSEAKLNNTVYSVYILPMCVLYSWSIPGLSRSCARHQAPHRTEYRVRPRLKTSTILKQELQEPIQKFTKNRKQVFRYTNKHTTVLLPEELPHHYMPINPEIINGIKSEIVLGIF